MAKNGELWDDYFLVNALDDSISKFKIMHVNGGDKGSPKQERITNDTEESAPNVINEEQVGPSNGDQIQDSDCSNVNEESAEHYNHLLNQYNAVEEERQKLLQQLYQYGSWNPQSYGYDYNSGYNAGYNPQYHTAYVPQISQPPVCAYRPNVCLYPNMLANNGVLVSAEDDGYIKAIPSFSKENSEGKKLEEDDDTTDLSVVLNAWFSAGFYTGKYHSEQASAKK